MPICVHNIVYRLHESEYSFYDLSAQPASLTFARKSDLYQIRILIVHVTDRIGRLRIPGLCSRLRFSPGLYGLSPSTLSFA
jgi:hypothetical protein